jgi:peptide/nickel transport system permease protein
MLSEGGHPLLWKRVFDSDIVYSFRRSPARVVMTVVLAVILFMCLFAPWVAPTNPYKIETLSLLDAQLPPRWIDKGDPRFVLGTDEQGRDIYSTILFGTRISIVVGVCSVLLALVLGVGLGLVAGYFGGWADAIIMRIAEVQLAFPAILMALMITGIVRAVVSKQSITAWAIPVLIVSIGLSLWVSYARTVRGMTLVERRREYVQAAQLVGASRTAILFLHILPNVLGPVLVIATIHLAVAIITEATLSFLGVGTPITEPSLGALIRAGNDFLFSGQWWQVIFPGITLVLVVLSVNLLGDWLRDYFNPKLR